MAKHFCTLLVLLLLTSLCESAAFCSDDYDPVCCLHGGVFAATKWNECLCYQYSGELMYAGECKEEDLTIMHSSTAEQITADHEEEEEDDDDDGIQTISQSNLMASPSPQAFL